MNITERFVGCIIGGAIGDAYGSAYENIPQEEKLEAIYYPFGKPEVLLPKWNITDDTQLTLATCEVIAENDTISPELFALKFLDFYKSKKITGIGSSTLKAMQELEIGGHWSLVGRKEEYAAGNGAAMRIAPLAFEDNISKKMIKDICNITHQNDEAYIGSLSVVIAIQSIINGTWIGDDGLIQIIIDKIPDTRVRDRLIEIDNLNCDLSRVGSLGNDGYVVNSVPLAIAFASKVKETGLSDMYKNIIDIGGDTDTNCSIAGQIAGALMGVDNIPIDLIDKIKSINGYNWINITIQKYIEKKKWIK